MSQFDNYDNIPEGYVPDNTTPMVPIKKTEIDIFTPKKEYNIWGKEIGIQTTYGDTVKIPISITGSIRVAQGSVVLYEVNQEPTDFTKEVGTYAYNVADIKCWKLVAVATTKVWQQIPFTYFSNGTTKITLAPDMTDKKLVAVIYNYRYEEVARQEWEEGVSGNFEIDKELSEKLYPGTYQVCVRIESEESVTTVSTIQLHITTNSIVQTTVSDTDKLIPKESEEV